MTYKVLIDIGYADLEFRFSDRIKALDFAQTAKANCIEDDKDTKVLLEIETCAGSGNSKVAHIKNQENDSTD